MSETSQSQKAKYHNDFTYISTTENNMKIPQKTKNKINIWTNTPTSGYTSKRIESRILKGYLHIMFTTALFTIAKRWKQHKCSSTDERTKKMWDIYTNGTLFYH